MRGVKWTGILAVLAAATSCSLALDLDALNAGSPVDSGTPPCATNADCDDGVGCTDDLCQEDGSCANLPNNSTCDYLEVCDPVEGCIPTGDECAETEDCDDGAACTVDSCVLGQCVNEPDHASCESDNPCIENEACDPVACAEDEGCDPASGCLPGNTVFCEQSGLPCRETACDPTTADGECVDFFVATADNDTDTYLDHACDGDDCDDENAAIHPGAAEPCDGVDDDCDGLTDVKAIVGPLEIDSAPAISTPSVAAVADLGGVVWQRGADGSGAVLAAVVGSDGALIDEALDFTSLGGTGAVGRAPDVASGATGFWVVWVADGPTTNPAATVVDLTADEVGGTVTAGTPVALGSGTATDVTLPRVAWDGTGSGWVASFAAAYADTSRTVELEAQDMHSSPAGSAFEVDSATGAIDGLSLAVIGMDRYAVAWAREDAASDDDLEVFASEIELAADAWSNAAGFPLRISPADVVAGDVDNSFWPSLAATGGGAWVAAFVDTDPGTVLESIQSDIALYDDGALSELVEAGTSFYREPALAFDGARFGFLYLSRFATSEALDFRTLDAAFAPPAAPYAGTRFSLLSDDDTSGARLVAVAADRFAAVWVRRFADPVDFVDHLEYLDFEVCGAGK